MKRRRIGPSVSVVMKRDLHLLAGAVFLSAAGDFLALITLALVVHELTGSAFAVAGFFATTMLPVALGAPVAGLIADRVESVRVLKLASLAQAGVAVGLAFGHTEYGLVLALTSLLTFGSAISAPAEFALIPAIVGEERIAHANGVMESARYAGFTVGPLAAAALAAVASTQTVLLVNAASFLAIAGAAALMRSRRHPVRSEHAEPDRARDGIAVLLGDRQLRATVGAAVAALLFMSVTITAEVFYVKDVLDAGDSGYALVTAAWMAGMVAGALGLAGRIPTSALAPAALVALAIQGSAVAAQTAWVVLPMALAGYLVGGVGHGLKNTLVRSLIALRVPDRLHGRAFAAYNGARNLAEVGALAAGGALVAGVGARGALAFAGTACTLAAVAGLVALRAPTGEIAPEPLAEVS